VIQFSDEEAIEAVKAFSKTEGLLVGESIGGALAVAKKLKAKLNPIPPHIVDIAPDSGFKYLSKMN
jgi:cysteine synthase